MIKKIIIYIIIIGIAALSWCFRVFAMEDYYSDLYGYEKPQKTISMDFKNASLSDVLKIFSQQSGLNFIASADISNKKINLYLDHVPVEEALERILSANNLTYEIKEGSNIFVVKRLQKPVKELMTRVYRLKYATVSNSKLNFTLSKDPESGGGTPSFNKRRADGIVAAVRALLTPDGRLVEDSRTNSIIVTDVPSVFPEIEQTIARLDVKVPQILIEVEMLDVSKNDIDKLGVEFGETPVAFSGGAREDVWPFNTDNAKDDGYSIGSDRYQTSKIDFTGLKFWLSFLKSCSDTKSLARPKILTLNNQTAIIQIKTDEAIGVASVTTTAGSQGITTAEAERVETGVILKVTPQANLATREIVMAIEPRVIATGEDVTFSTGAGTASFKNPEERSTRSILRVKDGDTVIIGGLVRSEASKKKLRVPLLGSIPILGMAFRNKDDSAKERELMIFITPTIIDDTLPQRVASEEFIRERSLPAQKVMAINKEFSRFSK